MRAVVLLSLLSALAKAQDAQRPLAASHCASALTPDALDALSTLQPPDVLNAWQAQDVLDLLKEAGDDCGLDAPRLIEVFGEDSEARWMTEGDKLRLRASGFDFIDITDHQDLGARRRAVSPAPLPHALPEVSVSTLREIVRLTEDLGVDALAGEQSFTQMQADLGNLTSFWTRSYRSAWGARSSDWLHGYVSEIVSAADPSVRITVRRVEHAFPQKSLVVRFENADAAQGRQTTTKDDDPTDATAPSDSSGPLASPDYSSPVAPPKSIAPTTPSNSSAPKLIILGAHQDSLNYKLPFYRAPGADDDGSGTVALLQVLRTLVGKTFTPPAGIAVELHWYAAEEGGLLGSQDVAAEYERAGAKVVGMLQMDGLAVIKHGATPKIGLFHDEVDKGLLDYVSGLIDAYLPIPWALTGCGKRCGSDHMSWTRAGYRAAYVCEGLFEEMGEGYHTVNDTTDLREGEYSFEHLARFVKLGITFIVELAVSSAAPL